MNMVDYTTGYKHALEGLDKFITGRIREMGGANTAIQIVHLYNSIIHQMKNEILEAKQVIEENKKEEEYSASDVQHAFEDTMTQLFGIKIKGAK